MSNLLKEFTHSLRCGTGRAYRILEKHPELPVDDLLIDAALHNYDYDPQCSGSRAFQIAELLKLRPNYRELILQIAERFTVEFNCETWEEGNLRHWDIVQLYELLAHNRVSPRVTEIIHDSFVHKHHLVPGVGHGAIMETEGVEGLLLIARTVGSSLRNNPDFEFDDRLPWKIRDIYEPDCDWHKILADESGKDIDIRTFLTAFEDCERKEKEREQDKTPRPPIDLKKIKEFLQERKRRYLGKIKLKKAEQTELRKMFMQETDTIRLDLLCLTLAKSECVTHPLIPKLLELSYNSHKRLAYRAIMALASLKSNQIRQIAIREMTENPDGWEFFELLEKNWQPGDEKLFLDWFNRLRSPHTRHSMIMSIRDVENAPAPLLKYLLNRTNCGCCREALAKKLAEQGALDNELCQEFLHDAMEDIREIGKHGHHQLE